MKTYIKKHMQKLWYPHMTCQEPFRPRPTFYFPLPLLETLNIEKSEYKNIHTKRLVISPAR